MIPYELREKVAVALHSYNREIALRLKAEHLVPTWEREPDYLRDHYRAAASRAIAVMQEVAA